MKLSLPEARGFVTNYTISYYPANIKRELIPLKIVTKIVDKDTNKTTISHIERNTSYVLQVFASTSAGDGNYSETTFLSTTFESMLLCTAVYCLISSSIP